MGLKEKQQLPLALTGAGRGGTEAAEQSRSTWAHRTQELTVATVNLYINSQPLLELSLALSVYTVL